MEAIKCSRGHYYDKSLGGCPVCAAEAGHRQSPFVAGSRVPDNIGATAFPNELFDIPATMPASGDFDFPVTVPASGDQDFPATAPASGSFDFPVRAPSSGALDTTRAPGMFTAPPTVSEPISDYAPTEAAFAPRTPVKWEIEDYGQTMPAMLYEKGGFDPVVGWLICVKGPNRGRDYRLHSGSNFIGRSKSMDVCIENDQTVSNRNHASVSYDDRSKTFYIAKGEVRNLIYLNGKPVRSDADLVSYDRIEIGNTELIFIALCSDRFDWQDK